MGNLNRLPAEGTKDRAKLEAMRRIATQRELEAIDGNGGWGTYKNDLKRYVDFLGGEPRIWGSGPSRRYHIVMPENPTTGKPDRSRPTPSSPAPVAIRTTTAQMQSALTSSSRRRASSTNGPAVLSIIGWHAGECVQDIVQRKRNDIERAGRTIWLYQSRKAPITMVQQFGRAFPNPAIIFLEGSAFPTSAASPARQMSANQNRWEPLPDGISPVTGKLPGGGLVIGELTLIDFEIDLWNYIQYLQDPMVGSLRFQRGASTACAVPSVNGPVEGMTSRLRRVVAIGWLVPPYGTFLR
jgi:hypothetical protein